MDCQRSGPSTQTLGADPEFIDRFEDLGLKLFQFLIGIRGSQGTKQGLFGLQGCLFKGSSDAHADDGRGTRIGPGFFNSFNDLFFDPGQAGRGREHEYAAHVFTPAPLGDHPYVNPVPRHQINIDYRRGIISGIGPGEGVAGGFTKISFSVSLTDSQVDRLFQVPSGQVQILAYF